MNELSYLYPPSDTDTVGYSASTQVAIYRQKRLTKRVIFDDDDDDDDDDDCDDDDDYDDDDDDDDDVDDDDDDLSCFLDISRAASGGSWVLNFHH